MRTKRISAGASNNTRHWTRDELIMALDVYKRLSPRTPSPNPPEVVELSQLLRSDRLHPVNPREPNFRSPASIVMKLMNFRSLDSAFEGKGLTAGGQLPHPLKLWGLRESRGGSQWLLCGNHDRKIAELLPLPRQIVL